MSAMRAAATYGVPAPVTKLWKYSRSSADGVSTRLYGANVANFLLPKARMARTVGNARFIQDFRMGSSLGRQSP